MIAENEGLTEAIHLGLIMGGPGTDDVWVKAASTLRDQIVQRRGQVDSNINVAVEIFIPGNIYVPDSGACEQAAYRKRDKPLESADRAANPRFGEPPDRIALLPSSGAGCSRRLGCQAKANDRHRTTQAASVELADERGLR